MTVVEGVAVKKTYKNDVLIAVSRTVDGKEHGEQETYYENGQLKSLAKYDHGKKIGDWKDYHPNGKVAGLVQHKNGVVAGKLRYYHPDGSIYYAAQRKYDPKNPNEKGPLHGKFIEKGENDCLVRKGKFNMGKKTGRWLEYKNCILVADVRFKNGIPVGKFKYYYDNGQLRKEGNHFDTTGHKLSKRQLSLHGEYKEYHKNGELAVLAVYDHGYRNGVVNQYNDDGKLHVSSEFKDEKELTRKVMSYYRRPHQDQMSNYKEYILDNSGAYPKNIAHGVERTWHKNGQLASESHSINGKARGDYIQYYENGQVSAMREAFNDSVSGAYVEYYPSGQLKQETRYITKNKGYNTSNVGWTKRYQENGDLELKMYHDSTGEGLIVYKEDESGRISYEHEDLLSLSYYDNGQLQSLVFDKRDHWQALALDYYRSGELRNIMMEDPVQGHLMSWYFSPEGKYVGHHHGSNSSIESTARLDYILPIINSIGWTVPSIEGLQFDEYTGKIRVKNQKGEVFFEAQMQDGLGHGFSYLLNPSTRDTILSQNLKYGKKQGWYKRYYAGARPYQIVYYNPDGSRKFYELYNRDGSADKFLMPNELGQQIEKEFFKDGRLEKLRNLDTREVWQYQDNGYLSYSYVIDSVNTEQLNYKTYHSNGQLNTSYASIDGKKTGLYLRLLESGDTLLYYNYVNDTLEGPAAIFKQDKGEVYFGNNLKGKKEGWWYTHKKGVPIDSIFFKDGEAQIVLADLPCECLEENASTKGFMQSIRSIVEEEDFIAALPKEISFHKDFNYSSNFFRNLQQNGNRDAVYSSFTLYTSQEISFAVTENQGLIFDLNPCLQKPNTSTMGIYYNGSKREQFYQLSINTPKLRMRFPKLPVKDEAKRPLSFTIPIEQLIFQSGRGFKLDENHQEAICYPNFTIGDGIAVQDLKLIQFELQGVSPWEDLKSLDAEDYENFIGVKAHTASAQLMFTHSGKHQKLSLSSSVLYFSDLFVAGKLYIDEVSLKGNTYQFKEGIKLNAAAIKSVMEQQGFKRIHLDYNEKNQQLSIDFYAQ